MPASATRLIQLMDHSGNKVVYTWDQGTNGIGRLSRVDEYEGPNILVTTQYTYDALGRIIQESRSARRTAADPFLTHSQHYTYQNGRLISRILPSGRVLTYQYTAASQRPTRITLTDIAPNANQQVVLADNILYHPMGRVKSLQDLSGHTLTFPIDLDGRITSYRLADSTWQLTYDTADRIIAKMNMQNAQMSASYGYDALNRLTSAHLPTISHTYTYDATGNRTQKVSGLGTINYTIDPLSNRILSTTISPAPGIFLPGGPVRIYTYDAAGNMTSDGHTSSGLMPRVYIYDARGRLSAVGSDGQISTNKTVFGCFLDLY